MISDYSPKILSDENINLGLVCAHMHSIARTFMSLTGECRQQKHTQHAPSTKTVCDYLNGWIKETDTYAKISPKMVNPRDLAGDTEEEKKIVHSWSTDPKFDWNCPLK